MSKRSCRLALAMLLVLAPSARAAEPDLVEPGVVETVLAIEVNGAVVSDGEVLLRRGGRMLLPVELVRRLSLTPDGAAVEHGGRAFVAVAAPDRVDAARQALVVTAPPSAFAGASYGVGPRPVPEPPSSPGAFLDYDIAVERGTAIRTDGLLAQAGVYGPFGLGTQSLRLRHTPTDTEAVRLDTAWTLDDPAEMRRLRVGDAVSAAGSWGRPVRFGGLRWGSAFDTAPGFVTAPTLALAGQTALPSEVEVYVNDALQRRQQVAPGPFTITDVPAVTGDGSLRMVVRDLLGREQVVLVPYYAGLGLLRPGLDDWSVEAGALRRDWGLDSNDYGEAFAAATWRHGFAQAFTGESHAELRPKRQAAGLGGALGTELGTVSASLAGSRSPGGGGVLGRLGWDYSGPRLGLGLTAEQASPAFSQLGLDDPRRLRARQQARASAGDPQLGSVAVSVSRLTYWREQEGATVSSLTHAVGLGWGTVISSATWTLPEHDRRDLTVGLTLVVPLAEATTATGGWSRSSTAGSRGYVQASRVPRDDEDWGVRALHEEGTVERSAVGGTLNTRMATLAVDAAQADGIQSLRLQAQGSVVAAGGGAFAGRGLGESFAVVDTGGHAGVGINRDNRRVATTDGDGRALVVGLRPYEANRIAIDPSDLPPEVETPALHQAVVPWRGAGSLVRFPLSTSRAAILRLVRPGGLPVPVGARAMVGGRPLDIPVGYDGQLLIAPGDRPGMVEVAWPGGGCRAELPPGGGAVLTTVPAECLSP